MAGAMTLATEAALRAGCGYAVACVPGSIAAEMTAGVPSAVLKLFGDAEREQLRADDLEAWHDAAKDADALAVGPGLGTGGGPSAFVSGVVGAVLSRGVTTVFDADALNAIAARDTKCTWPAQLAPHCVLTPHPGEAARLLGASTQDVQSDRARALAQLVESTRATVVLKGAETLVSGPEQPVWANSTGNPGMATAGSGDVLTGVIAALAARGMESWNAARVGVYLHGRAGDLAAAELGEESLIAADLLRYLPEAIREYPRAAS